MKYIRRAYYRFRGRLNTPIQHCEILTAQLKIEKQDGHLTADELKQAEIHVQAHLASNLLLDDETFTFSCEHRVVGATLINGDEVEVEVNSGRPYYGGVSHIDAPDVTFADGTTFSFREGHAQLDTFTRWVRPRLKNRLCRYVIQTYNLALQHPDQEAVLLYNVYEAMKYHYGPREYLRKLNVTKQQRSEIERICNDAGFRNSRHSGRASGGSRELSGDDRRKVRRIIKEMMIRHMHLVEP